MRDPLALDAELLREEQFVVGEEYFGLHDSERFRARCRICGVEIYAEASARDRYTLGNRQAREQALRVLVNMCLEHRRHCWPLRIGYRQSERPAARPAERAPWDEALANHLAYDYPELRPQQIVEQKLPSNAAEKKALALLKAKCTMQQWQDWCEHKHLFCIGSTSGATGLRYELTAKYSYNIFLWLFDKCVGKLCVSVMHQTITPLPDMILSQKLMIETDEESFIRLANISGVVDRNLGPRNQGQAQT